MNNLPDAGWPLKANGLQVEDSASALKDCVVFFAFPRSRSANFPIALQISQAATAHGEQNLYGRILYWAGFKNTIGDLQKAAELIRLAGTWAGAITRINGSSVAEPFKAYLTISCYLKGLQCTDQAAHCHEIIDDPFHKDYDPISRKVKSRRSSRPTDSVEFVEKIKRYVFPCKRMLEFSTYHSPFSFKEMHQVAHRDQIQAAAVEFGQSICPFFDPNVFAEIGIREMLTEEAISYQTRLLGGSE